MAFLREPLLEPVARWLRFKKGLQHVPRDRPLVILDIGCGPEPRFYHFAKNKIQIKKYIGIDPHLSESIINQYKNDKNVDLIASKVNSVLPFSDSSVDIIVAFAVLEHLNNPKKVISECVRILKKGGKAVFTTPTPRAKKILEFLSYRLNVISKEEIDEHNFYYDKEKLENLISKKDQINIKISHQYFEFGLNNIFVIKKIYRNR